MLELKKNKSILHARRASGHDFYSAFLSHKYRSYFRGRRCYIRTTMTAIHLRIPHALKGTSGMLQFAELQFGMGWRLRAWNHNVTIDRFK